MANGTVYMLVSRDGKPLTINSQLPIFWKRSIAEKKAAIHKCSFVPLPQSMFDIDIEKRKKEQTIIFYKKEDFR